ncbi:cell division protein ZipA [Thalassomonas sp. M1454]|uniref:cell division protein ZipA n=1 Tax=Thalassomonas sp. M1454 TaxID=2594477 RepID=UPI00117F4E2E|nr:cell division protein ZipA [Thalassomonas sp. M1454]TRX56440.1 cell division protein ZipA [Thalassomonas sp. M1454]
MELNFRDILIIISVVAICGIYINGRYKIRKGKNPYKLKSKQAPEVTEEPLNVAPRAFDPDGFDQDGVGRPKPVIDDHKLVETTPVDLVSAPIVSEEESLEQTLTEADVAQFEQSFEPVVEPYEQAVTEPLVEEPQMSEQKAPETVTTKSKTENTSKAKISKPVFDEPVYQEPTFKEPVFAEPSIETPQAESSSEELPAMSALDEGETAKPAKVAEPKPAKVTKLKAKTRAELKRDQLEIDFDASQEKKKVEIEQEVLALSVVMPDNQAISGAALLPSLLTLGMKFGEMNIFHRHQDNAGNGQITFSLANMVNPGTFDVDNMETFSTKGLTLFMTLPNAGEPAKVFNYMLSAAKQLAQEFGGQVLDSKRSVMTKQTEQHYLSQIREFDRKSRLAGY